MTDGFSFCKAPLFWNGLAEGDGEALETENRRLLALPFWASFVLAGKVGADWDLACPLTRITPFRPDLFSFWSSSSLPLLNPSSHFSKRRIEVGASSSPP